RRSSRRLRLAREPAQAMLAADALELARRLGMILVVGITRREQHAPGLLAVQAAFGGEPQHHVAIGALRRLEPLARRRARARAHRGHKAEIARPRRAQPV